MKKILLLLLICIFLNISLYSQSTQKIEKNQFSEIKKPFKTISPYVTRLLKLDDVNLEMELKKFWLSTKEMDLPLVEKDVLDDDFKYLTIIFQNSSPNKEISFDVLGIYEDKSLGNKNLRRLRNTDFYYRSFKLPNDICFSYRFIVKDTVTGKSYKSIDKYNSNRIPIGEKSLYSYSVVDFNLKDAGWKNLNEKIDKNLDSKIDTIRYTDKIVHKDRKIYIYLPPKYNANREKAYTVIYLFDAFIYLNRVEVPNILDNMISKGQIEPMIAVMIGTSHKTRKVILPLNFYFKDEFIGDILPLVREKYNISKLPENNIIGGMSYGGLAASFIAFYHPDIFGKVLSQSGSLWRGFDLLDKEGNWLRYDWLIEQYQTQDRKKLKLFFDWGLQENWVLGANRKMMNVLKKKEYQYKYIEFNGWHDSANSRKIFPKGLLYLLN